MNYREMYDNGQFQEIYDLTKSNLDTIEAKAWYLIVFLHIEGGWHNPSNLDRILEFEQEFKANKEEYPLEYGMFLVRLGRGYHIIGEMNKGIDVMKEGLSYLEKYDKELYAGFLVNLGGAYGIMGEFDRWLQIVKTGLKIAEQGNSLQLQGFLHLYTGLSYFSIGEIDKALEHMFEGRKRIKKSKNKNYYYIALARICEVMLLSGKREDVTPYLNEYEELSEEFPPNILDFKMIKALYLKTSHRLRHKIDAERMYRRIIAETPLDELNSPGYLEVYKHLCELLLMELKTYGEREVLEEIQSYIDLLFDNSQKLHLYVYLVDAYILKSRMFLINGDFNQATEILNEGLEVMRAKNLLSLEKTIFKETKKLENEFLTHKSILQSNVSFSEKIEKLQLEEYFRIATGTKEKYENK